MAKNALDRNFGSRKTRGRENKRIARDKLIDKKIRAAYRGSLLRHRFHSIPIEPMSPYLGAVVPFGQSTGTAFPVTKQYNKRPMPQFKDLSKWFKFDLATMAMQEYGFVTFNINLHPELERQWVKEGKDPATELRARINKEVRKLSSCPDAGWEYAFVVEGWGKQSHLSKDWSNPKRVRLHIHGFAALYEKGDEELLRKTLAKACGDGLKGYPKQSRAKSIKMFKQSRNRRQPKTKRNGVRLKKRLPNLMNGSNYLKIENLSDKFLPTPIRFVGQNVGRKKKIFISHCKFITY